QRGHELDHDQVPCRPRHGPNDPTTWIKIRTTMKRTVKLRSKATVPNRSGGMKRRRNLRGGSVAVYVTSASTSTAPVGRQERANACTVSKIILPMRSTR